MHAAVSAFSAFYVAVSSRYENTNSSVFYHRIDLLLQTLICVRNVRGLISCEDLMQGISDDKDERGVDEEL